MSLLTLSPGETSLQRIVTIVRQLVQYVQGVWRNARLAKLANYTVATGDNGSTIALGGNTFFTLTFPAPTGFNASFAVLVVNEDTWSSGRAKYISFPGGVPTNRYLYPGQSMLVFLQNGVWQNNWARVKVPGGPLTINCHGASGSDTDGVSDGLATGAGAFLSLQHALHFMLQNFDFSSQPQTLVTLLMGANDPGLIHYAPHDGQAGAQGGAAILIDMGGHQINTGAGGGTAIQTYFASVLQLRNGTVISDGGWAIETDWGSKMFVLDLVTFGIAGITALGHLHGLNGSKIEVDNNYTVAGNVSQGHVLASALAIVNLGVVATFSNNFSGFTAWIQSQFGSQVLASGSTWTLAGHTVTAPAYSVTSNAVITGTGSLPGTAGSTATGGQAI